MGSGLIALPPVITALLFAATMFKSKPLHKEIFMIKTDADLRMFYEFWFW